MHSNTVVSEGGHVPPKRAGGLGGEASPASVAPQSCDGQATKGTWWMPWRQEAMKDVVSCDKLRGAASRRRSGDSRVGQPGQGYTWSSASRIHRLAEANPGN